MVSSYETYKTLQTDPGLPDVGTELLFLATSSDLSPYHKSPVTLEARRDTLSCIQRAAELFEQDNAGKGIGGKGLENLEIVDRLISDLAPGFRRLPAIKRQELVAMCGAYVGEVLIRACGVKRLSAFWHPAYVEKYFFSAVRIPFLGYTTVEGKRYFEVSPFAQVARKLSTPEKAVGISKFVKTVVELAANPQKAAILLREQNAGQRR